MFDSGLGNGDWGGNGRLVKFAINFLVPWCMAPTRRGNLSPWRTSFSALKRAPSRVPSAHLLFKSLDRSEENPSDVFYLGPHLFHFFVFLQVFYACHGDLNIMERFQNRFTALSEDIYIAE